MDEPMHNRDSLVKGKSANSIENCSVIVQYRYNSPDLTIGSYFFIFLLKSLFPSSVISFYYNKKIKSENEKKYSMII